VSQSPDERPPGVPDPSDPGGSENRDLMGWQRTTMALVAVGAASARHSWSTAGVYALLPLGLMLLVAAWVLAEGWRRYDEDREGIETTPGGPTFVLAATVALTAAVELHHMARP
jgi:uncharacterized membrane protein YidH (DUF202 family)